MAITCSSVFTSGAGTSFSSPNLSSNSAMYRRVIFSKGTSEGLLGLQTMSPLAPSERHVHHRALPSHPGRERGDLAQSNVGGVADAPLGRAPVMVVNHPVACIYFHAAVFEADRYGHHLPGGVLR